MGDYDDVVADVRRTTEAAVHESQERVDQAVRRGEQADRDAAEASKAVGTRWANRITAMRRRTADRDQSTELTLGHEDGPHPNDHTEADDLTSLTESVTDVRTPPLGISGDLLEPVTPPPQYPTDDEDYSARSWLRDR
ncbi:MAG TPA: hypothetical protein VFW65_31175 [Pseudonocardiaceae bacterium]|nr:hypothetical protein [Pseudonocardiaceae bacterium]